MIYMPNNKNRTDNLGDRVKSHFKDAGLEVIDMIDLLNGIQTAYIQPSVEEVIAEELPLILAADPQFFLKNQIYLGSVTERLKQLY